MKTPTPPLAETITVRHFPYQFSKELIIILFQQSGLEKTSEDFLNGETRSSWQRWDYLTKWLKISSFRWWISCWLRLSLVWLGWRQISRNEWDPCVANKEIFSNQVCPPGPWSLAVLLWPRWKHFSSHTFLYLGYIFFCLISVIYLLSVFAELRNLVSLKIKVIFMKWQNKVNESKGVFILPVVISWGKKITSLTFSLTSAKTILYKDKVDSKHIVIQSDSCVSIIIPLHYKL